MTPSTSRPSFPDPYDVTQFGSHVRERPVGKPLILAWAAMVLLVGLVVLGYFAVRALGIKG